MLLAEILDLDKTQASIRKIDLFLTNLQKTSKDYLIALSYKALILNKIGKPNEALRILFPLVVNFKIYDTDAIIAICDAIITICLDAKRYDQVEKYIEVKNKYLPISKKTLHTLDEVKYYMAINDREKTKASLLSLIADDTTKEEKLYAEKELSKIYYSEQQYDKYLEYASDLEDYYQTNLAFDDLNELMLNKLKIAYIRENYTKVICDGNIYIKENIPTKMIIQIATLLIQSYLACNDYKRASITESNYEELLSEEYAKESLEFCKAALDLYTKTKTIISVNEYQNKIKIYDSLTKEVKKEKKSRKKPIEVEIPVVELPVEEEEEIVAERLLYTEEEEKEPIEEVSSATRLEPVVAKISNVVVSEGFNKLASVFKVINEIDFSIKYREIFRRVCIEICKAFPIEEIYILYFKGQYLGIQYKKERAYDKKLTPELLEGTLPYEALLDEEELFFDYGDTEYNKNIVNGKPFETDTYMYSTPIRNDIEVMGSLTYLSSVPFLDKEMTYESLKLITSVINSRLLMYLRQDDLEKDNQKLFFITNNMSSGIKEEAEGYIHFSDAAVKILGVIPDMTPEDYYLKMKSTELGEYKRIIDELYTLLSSDLEYEYDFKKDNGYIRVKERFYPVLIGGIIHIYSLIDDITEISRKNDALLSLAYHNPISKMDTELKLSVDLAEYYPKKKLSLAIIEVQELDLYKDLYGYNFKKQLILAIGEKLQDAFTDDFDYGVYHLDSENYAVLLTDMNDKRAVDARLNKALNQVASKLKEINTRVKLTFNVGVYRLGKNTNLDNPSEIITYAFGALDLAKDIDSVGTHICHYDGELDKKRHYTNALVTHISESIDHGKIGLTYQQIVDIKNNQVFGYYLKLNLDNLEVDENIMASVIKKKGLSKSLEQYAIINALKEQKMFYEQMKSFLLCFIRISDNNIDEAFFNYIEHERAFYKIKPSTIVLDTTSANNPILQKLRSIGYSIASSNILDVYSQKCDYYMYDYHSYDIKIDEIKSLCDKHAITMILSEINEKNDIDFAKASELNLVFGKFYKKSLRMKLIIDKLNNK